MSACCLSFCLQDFRGVNVSISSTNWALRICHASPSNMVWFASSQQNQQHAEGSKLKRFRYSVSSGGRKAPAWDGMLRICASFLTIALCRGWGVSSTLPSLMCVISSATSLLLSAWLLCKPPLRSYQIVFLRTGLHARSPVNQWEECPPAPKARSARSCGTLSLPVMRCTFGIYLTPSCLLSTCCDFKWGLCTVVWNEKRPLAASVRVASSLRCWARLLSVAWLHYRPFWQPVKFS